MRIEEQRFGIGARAIKLVGLNEAEPPPAERKCREHGGKEAVRFEIDAHIAAERVAQRLEPAQRQRRERAWMHEDVAIEEAGQLGVFLRLGGADKNEFSLGVLPLMPSRDGNAIIRLPPPCNLRKQKIGCGRELARASHPNRWHNGARTEADPAQNLIDKAYGAETHRAKLTITFLRVYDFLRLGGIDPPPIRDV